jgi:hypothetical protein
MPQNIALLGQKDLEHSFSYAGRDLLELHMVDPIFSGILGERKLFVTLYWSACSSNNSSMPRQALARIVCAGSARGEYENR